MKNTYENGEWELMKDEHGLLFIKGLMEEKMRIIAAFPYPEECAGDIKVMYAGPKLLKAAKQALSTIQSMREAGCEYDGEIPDQNLVDAIRLAEEE